MSRHPIAEVYMEERRRGIPVREIARKYGVSRQAVYCATGEYSPQFFVPFTPKQVVYPNLRRWMNENRVSKKEFIRRMGHIAGGTNSKNLTDWLLGKCYPSKKDIDLMLKVTGLTYEQLFYTEEE